MGRDNQIKTMSVRVCVNYYISGKLVFDDLTDSPVGLLQTVNFIFREVSLLLPCHMFCD